MKGFYKEEWNTIEQAIQKLILKLIGSKKSREAVVKFY